MKVVFAGTPDVAIPTLETLTRDHEVTLVITRHDAPQGRRRTMTPSVVAQWATREGIPTLKVSSFTHEIEEVVTQAQADIGVVVAFGSLIPASTLMIPTRGWINLHFSALPRWRGAAPVQRALMAGERDTAVTVFRLVETLDAGDILASRPVSFRPDDTAGSALARFAVDGADLVRGVLSAEQTGGAAGRPQRGEPTYAHKLTLADAQLRATESAEQAYNRYRGVTPEPGAWIESSSGSVKVLECEPVVEGTVAPGRRLTTRDGVIVGFHTGCLRFRRVHPAGRVAMSSSDWARGAGSDEAWTFE